MPSSVSSLEGEVNMDRNENVSLPHWQALSEMVREAPELFPGFLCQGWAIAICPSGPAARRHPHALDGEPCPSQAGTECP
jgi:hypothetical protein